MKFMVILLQFLLLVGNFCEAFKNPSTTIVGGIGQSVAEKIDSRMMSSKLHGVTGDDAELSNRKLPKVIIFDLDGCLWTPEMYQIVFYMGGKGAPFRDDPDCNEGGLLTVTNKPVKLLGDVRSVFREIRQDPAFDSVQIGVSSRTDKPDWARELLEKFTVVPGHNGERVFLKDIFNGPLEIAKDAKVEHFARIRDVTGCTYEEMVFFDNEYDNCRKVAELGVSVVYCPDGVTWALWEQGLKEEFPTMDGSVINAEARGW